MSPVHSIDIPNPLQEPAPVDDGVVLVAVVVPVPVLAVVLVGTVASVGVLVGLVAVVVASVAVPVLGVVGGGRGCGAPG
jgi:hypothetical protein